MASDTGMRASFDNLFVVSCGNRMTQMFIMNWIIGVMGAIVNVLNAIADARFS
jgi:hypothetical protein